MPREDQTGPEGGGPLTGRRLGRCSGDMLSTPSRIRSPRYGRGNRRQFLRSPSASGTVNRDTALVKNPTNLFDQVISLLEEIRELKNSMANISAMVRKLKSSKKRK